MNSTIILDNDLQFTYYDSGAPSERDYRTIFALHGAGFTGAVWTKVLSIAPQYGVRFIAVNRRGYGGSSSYSQKDIKRFTEDDENTKAAFLRDTSHDILKFIDAVVTKEHLPEVSEDGKTGGIGLLGWSIGNDLGFATIANADTISDDIKARLTRRLRSLILHEVGNISLGDPPSSDAWTPSFDQSIPEDDRFFVFVPWICSYFEHKSITSRKREDLYYARTSLTRVPTIFNISKDSQTEVIAGDGQGYAVDVLLALNLLHLTAKAYQKAVFDKGIRELFPHLKVGLLSGSLGPATAILGHWIVEAENARRGGGYVDLKFLEGGNHVSQWDDPEGTLKAYIALLD